MLCESGSSSTQESVTIQLLVLRVELSHGKENATYGMAYTVTCRLFGTEQARVVVPRYCKSARHVVSIIAVWVLAETGRPLSTKMSVDSLVLTRHGVFGIIILVVVRGVS